MGPKNDNSQVSEKNARRITPFTGFLKPFNKNNLTACCAGGAAGC
jgi:hypothetical protein